MVQGWFFLFFFIDLSLILNFLTVTPLKIIVEISSKEYVRKSLCIISDFFSEPDLHPCLLSPKTRAPLRPLVQSANNRKMMNPRKLRDQINFIFSRIN